MTALAIKPNGTVTFRYDADAVAMLKDAVPSYARSFDPETKAWKVELEWLPKLIEAAVAAGHTIGDEPPRTPKVDTLAGFFGASDSDKAEAKARAASIVDSIPEPLRHRVLREVARLLYPDLYSGRR